jgi:adenosylhomocysteine nucleosidase
MPRLAFVAALEREVAPLVQTWRCRTLECGGRRYKVFESGEAVVICGGIGSEAARRATEAIIRDSSPSRIVSIGFAGALDPALKVGDVIRPGVVINGNDGSRTNAGTSEHALVSYPSVCGSQQKRKLREAFRAALVDMEAAAVAQGAEARGIEFRVLKVVSDDSEFEMPDVQSFVTGNGEFRSSAFALHVILRPWLWATTIRLGRNSARASRILCNAISDYVRRETVSTAAPV